MALPTPKIAPELPEWLSFHLYYHEDPGRAVTGFVAPAVSAALGSGWIERFFFLRYSLGGPHVRVRLRPVPGCEAAVAEATRQAAEDFLHRTPSTRPLAEEVIRGQNRAILASDPHETDDAAYPDNTFLSFPFRPEVERYGGEGQLDLSLYVFTASSLEALRFLASHSAEPTSRRLVLALRFLLRQALYFAADEEELRSLLGYAIATWGDSCQGILEKGERVFGQQQDAFGQILRRAVENLAAEALNGGLTLGAAVHRLSFSLAGRERTARWRIGGSHLHMTANRLGLSNPEEVYVGRLLTAAAEHFLAADPGFRRDLQEALAARRDREPPEALPLPSRDFLAEFEAPPA